MVVRWRNREAIQHHWKSVPPVQKLSVTAAQVVFALVGTASQPPGV